MTARAEIPDLDGALREQWGLVPDAITEVHRSRRGRTWRAEVDDTAYAVRLGRPGTAGGFATARALAAAGVPGIAAPVATRAGAACADLGGRPLTVTPWLEGVPALEAGEDLGRDVWRAFGALVAAMHRVAAPAPARQPDPADLAARLEGVRAAVLGARRGAAHVSALRRGFRDHRRRLDRATRWLSEPRDHGPAVACHGDLHLGNLLVVDGAPVLLDWEDAGAAPRELDLLYLDGGGALERRVRDEELRWFTLGYGRPLAPDPEELAWQRALRVVEDVVLDAESALDEALDPPTRMTVARQGAQTLTRLPGDSLG